MASKSLILITVLVTLFAASQVEAQLGLIGNVLGLINVGGTVFCSTNGNAVANATTPTPPFPNALVQLRCDGNVISSTLTNGSGVFNIIVNPLQFLLSTLLSTCNVVVATPLASCNSGLSTSGILQSPLQFVGRTVQGLLSIVQVVTTEFQLLSI